MAANPNPARIPDPIWWLWENFKAFEPTVQLGGIYANKSGYHNTRAANVANWPGNYSYRDDIDKQGPGDKAAAIDLTFPDAQNGDYKTIKKYANRLMAAGVSGDLLMKKYLKEFFGQNDDDSGVEGWDYRRGGLSTSDSSHLWHIHISFTRAYVMDMDMARAVLSVLTGVATTPLGDDMFCTFGDRNDKVVALQAMLTGLGFDTKGVDGQYGNNTAAALKNALGDPNNTGRNYGPWEYSALFLRQVGPLGGEKGDKGDPGPKGDTGPKGDKGDAGPKGDTGAKGDSGPKGDTGDTGPKGDSAVLAAGTVLEIKEG